MYKCRSLAITGATGFVGGALLGELTDYNLTVFGRNEPANLNGKFVKVDLSSDVDYGEHFKSIDVVIHCAARAHIMSDDELDPLSTYREINTAGTLNLARQAADAGVKRFIFISTIKVNGESTTGKPAFNEGSLVNPKDPYSISKMEAEQGLRAMSDETGLEVVIIRPPLVYGEGVKANFLSLLKLSSSRIPLPFGSIRNKRSMIYIVNLVDFISVCIDHTKAANQTFIISDGVDVSLTSLLIYLRKAFGQSPRLMPFPMFLFKFAGALAGKRAVVDRLIGDLQVDSSKAQKVLAWTPPFTVEQAIQETVNRYVKGNN